MDIAQYFQEQKYEISNDAFMQGLKDVLADKALFSEEDKTTVMMAFQQELRAKSMEAGMKEAEGLKKAGTAFLAENKKKAGVVELPSGLQYKIVKEGKGPKPQASDMVTVHYKGTLIDGKVFDSSYDRGEPIEFQLNKVIPGWTEGVMLMNVGSKYELYIPSDLAYGDRGAGETIPGGSALIFEVELLSFKPGPADAPAEVAPTK